MKRTLLLASLLGAACRPAETPAPPADTVDTYVPGEGIPDTLWLLGATPAADALHAADTESTLVARFGEPNVRRDSIPGAEGASVYGTVLFPTDSTRTLYLYWKDDAFRGLESARTAPGATAWVVWPGIAPGAPLADVERLNGGPFDLFGFEWDYGGVVTDWKGGALARLKADTLGFTAVRFSPARSARGASGEDTFSSAAPAVRAADPRVSDLTVQLR